MAGNNESKDKASWAVYTRAHGRGGLRLWWKPRGSGYTTNVHEAGLFTREEDAVRLWDDVKAATT